MRLRILAAALPFLLSTGCRRRDPVKPTRPAVQIIIPDTPGWSPASNNTQIYASFDIQLRERIRMSGGVIGEMTWATKDMATVVTLYGDHPDQILTITLPFFRAARLPAGTSVTKYDGVDGTAEQAVPIT